MTFQFLRTFGAAITYAYNSCLTGSTVVDNVVAYRNVTVGRPSPCRRVACAFHTCHSHTLYHLMLSRITVPLLAAAVLVFACGPRPPKSVANARPRSSVEKGVTSHVMVDTTRGEVRFAIEVSNDSRKRVELDFPDGRTHDFIVLDQAGREVWRWSAGRMFTQGMQNRLLEAHDAVVYAERWHPAAKGQYTLVAQLHSENYPVRQRVGFALQ